MWDWDGHRRRKRDKDFEFIVVSPFFFGHNFYDCDWSSDFWSDVTDTWCD